MFLGILQNSLESTCARASILIKLACNFIKIETHRCFPVNFEKFLRTPFLTEHLRWLLLYLISYIQEIYAFYVHEIYNSKDICKNVLFLICQDSSWRHNFRSCKDHLKYKKLNISHHSHKKRKDSLETLAEPAVFSL